MQSEENLQSRLEMVLDISNHVSQMSFKPTMPSPDLNEAIKIHINSKYPLIAEVASLNTFTKQGWQVVS